jgi:hypothetical protein
MTYDPAGKGFVFWKVIVYVVLAATVSDTGVTDPE